MVDGSGVAALLVVWKSAKWESPSEAAAFEVYCGPRPLSMTRIKLPPGSNVTGPCVPGENR